MKCARCHRRLTSAAAWLAGMPLGPKCAKAAGAAIANPIIQTRTDRATAAQEAAYRERQAELFHVEPA